MTLPMDKLCLGLIDPQDDPQSSEIKKTYVVLVSTGSFNPPTYMHMRCFELARDALNSAGFCVIGGYMSPVNDAYKKKGLISAEHRLAMCNLACRSSEFVMVDPWEANQSTYQRTLTVLSRIKTALCESGLVFSGTLKVMLICGSDLVESFSTPGVWIRDQVEAICRDFGLVCIRRDGQDVEKMINDDDILNNFKSAALSPPVKSEKEVPSVLASRKVCVTVQPAPTGKLKMKTSCGFGADAGAHPYVYFTVNLI